MNKSTEYSSLSLASTQRASTGAPGLDDILGGGLTTNRVHLVEGTPGTGKTTLALQFLLEGLKLGEKGLYITLSETSGELQSIAESHGWSLDELSLFELVLIGDMHSDVDLSYLSDATISFRFFEANGQMRTAVFVIKSRTNDHQRTLHEFRLSSGQGIQVGEALENFEGILTGLPTYRGVTKMLGSRDANDAA